MISGPDGISPEVLRWLNDLQSGRNVTVGQVTLVVSPATTTVVPCRGCSTSSTVVLMPVNAAAGTEFGSGAWHVTAGKTEFTITHSSSAGSRVFRYVVFTGTKQL